VHGGFFLKPPDGLLSKYVQSGSIPRLRPDVVWGTRPQYRNAVQQVFLKARLRSNWCKSDRVVNLIQQPG
jgi:hypothetical protein